MDTRLNIDVSSLDAPHRQALEEVIGRELTANQRLLISVIDVAVPPGSAARPAQQLEDWTSVYDGLSEEEIQAVDTVSANCDLPRPRGLADVPDPAQTSLSRPVMGNGTRRAARATFRVSAHGLPASPPGAAYTTRSVESVATVPLL
jgi:hypothetical protein